MAGDRREEEVRRLMDGPHPQVPPDFAHTAIVRGQRVLRRRRLTRHISVVVGLAVLLVFTVWAVHTQPWQTDTTPTTPPGIGW